MGLPTRLECGVLRRSKEVETTLQRQDKELLFGKGWGAGLLSPGQSLKGKDCSPWTFLSLALSTTLSALQAWCFLSTYRENKGPGLAIPKYKFRGN